MRFDDMIGTVLERPCGRADERAAQWRQLVDLLAQRRQATGSDEVDAAYDFLRHHRAEVALQTRERTAAALAGLRVAPELVAFFAEDHPTVATPLLRSARLTSAEWVVLLPSLSPTGRAVLRHRRDLSPEVRAALEAFGTTDFVLETDIVAVMREAPATPVEEAAEAPAQPEERSQIWELVERIEAFQRSRDHVAHEAAEAAEEFRWETGPEGVILWVDGAPRGPLVGQSIATIGEHGQYGVDGQAAGAFHKRAPFRDARFNVAGYGAASGDWRISGVPYFDVHRGNFLGYRGTARRPRLGEVAAVPDESGLFGSSLHPDSLRQLVHELKTPLNAIIGFAELIEGQYMGPAGSQYRGRAGEIVDQARRLLSAVDDLDTAARIESGRPEHSDSEVDAAALLSRLHQAYEAEAAQHSAAIAIRIEADLPPAAIEPAAAERMLSRMLAATIGLAGESETIHGEFAMGRRGGKDLLCLAIDRPHAIHGLDEMALLHPGYSPDGDWPGAPSLGLGFALRLVRKLAEAAGGALDIGDERFMLYLPIAARQAPASDSSGTGA